MSARIIPESSPNAGQRRNCDSTRRAAGFRLTIFCAKQWTGSKKLNRLVQPDTTMPFCGGTPAPASLSGTNSSRAQKKNESNFLWNSYRASVSDATRGSAFRRNALYCRCHEREGYIYAIRARGLATRGAQIRFRLVV